MESSNRQGCRVGGKFYSHGSQVCETDKCYRCDDGEWEDRFIDLVYGVGP